MFSTRTLDGQVLLITGGAGFIGSTLVRHVVKNLEAKVVVVDNLTYAGNLASLKEIEGHPNFYFEKVDITDKALIDALIQQYRPQKILHLAAESHVDRSIDGPAAFVMTNVVGTYTLLEAAREYWSNLKKEARGSFRFLHVSTDEVYGSLGSEGLFTEDTSYDPNSPYSASKASSDHLVRAWYHTYGLPVLITNCSNNYGPYQYPEKLIPVVILNALQGKPIPVYGTGENVRDWLYVHDHVEALLTVLLAGKVGETYNIGGHNEMTNIGIVQRICATMNELVQNRKVSDFNSLITFVEDRPGHDFRYAIDASKIERDLGWLPAESFATGIEKTIVWYLNNLPWCNQVIKGTYNLERLGLINQEMS